MGGLNKQRICSKSQQKRRCFSRAIREAKGFLERTVFPSHRHSKNGSDDYSRSVRKSSNWGSHWVERHVQRTTPAECAISEYSTIHTNRAFTTSCSILHLKNLQNHLSLEFICFDTCGNISEIRVTHPLQWVPNGPGSTPPRCILQLCHLGKNSCLRIFTGLILDKCIVKVWKSHKSLPSNCIGAFHLAFSSPPHRVRKGVRNSPQKATHSSFAVRRR